MNQRGKEEGDSLNGGNPKQGLFAENMVWFSSVEHQVEPLDNSNDLRDALAVEDGVPDDVRRPDGVIVGFELDLDHDGINEVIVRSCGKDASICRQLLLRLVEGKWEVAARFAGDFLIVRQAEGWMDDIVADVPNHPSGGTKSTCLKFNGMLYREVWELVEVGTKREFTRVAPDPVVPPPPERLADWQSPLVGAWACALDYSDKGPTMLNLMIINRDGSCESTMVETGSSIPEAHPGHGVRNGAQSTRWEVGRIDLRTGRQVIVPSGPSVPPRSIHWEVIEDKLHYVSDLGGMGGETLRYSRVD